MRKSNRRTCFKIGNLYATIAYKDNKCTVFDDDIFIKNTMKDRNIEYRDIENKSIENEKDMVIMDLQELLMFRHCGKKNDTGWIMYKYNNANDMVSDYNKHELFGKTE